MSIDFFQPPSFQHFFGTDSFGRDVTARICFGARTSILLGFSVMVTSTLGGLVIGLLSGISKRLDFLSVQAIDILMAFPELILALGLMAILGQATINIVIALTAVYTAKMARVARSSVLSISEQTYMEAARGIGSSPLRILLLHVLPNAAPPIIVQGSFVFGWTIILESGLSFIGVGIQPPTASLGNILSDARIVLIEAPWIALFSGAFIMLTVLGINFTGDGLRQALDPHLKGVYK
jgi:peptide/nickel transport system permease protein